MKCLYSPGYGSGWATDANNKAVGKFVLTYKPIIDFLEAGNKFERHEMGMSSQDTLHPLLEELIKVVKEKFNANFCIYGAHQLKVVNLQGPIVCLKCFDGSEDIWGNGLNEDEFWIGE